MPVVYTVHKKKKLNKNVLSTYVWQNTVLFLLSYRGHRTLLWLPAPITNMPKY
jgi:hypothetical protein